LGSSLNGIELTYHEPLDRDLSKVSQDKEFGSLGPLVTGQADEIRSWRVVMLIQYVKSVKNQVRMVMNGNGEQVEMGYILCPMSTNDVQ
jgi:hypothetical protein